jgi:hypothetical protein
LISADHQNRSTIPTEPQAPEKYFDFLGLIIVRKADLLAATAFLLAAGSAIYQAGGYLWGAHVRAFAPDRVALFFDHYSDNEIVTRIAGELTFTNSGQLGRDATVREAWVDMSGPGLSIREYWTAFPKISREGEGLKIEADEDAFPLQVPGDGTISKLTSFAPTSTSCKDLPDCKVENQLLADADFLSWLSAHVGTFLTLQFQATTFEGVVVSSSTCEVRVTRALITYLGANDWYMSSCAPKD